MTGDMAEPEPTYCPYDCGHCHDNDCTCPNCSHEEGDDGQA